MTCHSVYQLFNKSSDMHLLYKHKRHILNHKAFRADYISRSTKMDAPSAARILVQVWYIILFTVLTFFCDKFVPKLMCTEILYFQNPELWWPHDSNSKLNLF